MKTIALYALVVISFAILTSSAEASVTTYSSRATYEAATAAIGSVTTIDFSTRDDGTPITSPGSDTYFDPLILRGATFNGQSYYNSFIYVGPGGYITANLPANTLAFGVDLSAFYGSGGTFTVTLSSGQSYSISRTAGAPTFSSPPSFFGLTSDQPIQWAKFTYDNDYCVVDNFTYTAGTGLVSYWPADGNVNDVTGPNNGELRNNAGFTTGVVGQAFNLDGSSGYVEVLDSPSLSLTGPFTLEAMVYLNANTDQQAIIEKYDVPQYNGYLLRILDGKLLATVCGNGSQGCSQPVATGVTTVSAGNWHHVAAVYDGTSIEVYLDGTLDGIVTANFAPADGSTSLKIGARGDDANTRLNGLIDEVKIYNRALSAAEIETESNIVPPPTPTPTPTPTPVPTPDDCVLPLFAAPRLFSVGAPSDRAAIADYNNDGNKDIAVVSFENSFAAVFLGDGTGNFGSPNILPAGDFSVPIGTGDFNHDGNADLAVGSRDGFVWIYLGNGTGGFGPVSKYPDGGGEAYDIAVADLDHDGNADLAIAHQFTGLSILLGTGAGGFSEPTTLNNGMGPVEVDQSDFNNDGNIDLITDNAQGGNATVFLGNGAGGFTINNLSMPRPGGFGIGDLNSDGNVDIVVTDSVGYVLRHGDGHGNFGAPTFLSSGGGKAKIADIDGDGHPDVAGTTVGTDGTWQVSILLNDGAGGFQPLSTYPTGSAPPGDFELADLNNDGRPDIVTINQYGGDISVLINNNGRLDTTPPVISITDNTVDATGPAGAAVSYNLSALDDSGRVASLSCNTPSGSMFPIGTTQITCTAADYCGNSGSQSFNINVVDQPPVLSLPNGVTVGDSCPSGKVVHYVATATDVVSGNLPVSCNPPSGNTFPIGETTVTCSATDGGGHTSTGTFNVNVMTEPVASFDAPRHFSNGSTTVRTATADFNNDGNLDIAATAHDASYVGVFLGDGTGDFSGPAVLPAGGFSVPVSTGDFNNDGNQDLVVGSNDGTVWIYLGDGTGSFGAAAQYADGDGEAYEMAVADFNGDGNLDLAVGHQFGGLAIMLGDGSGAFSMVSTYIPESGPVKVAPADFNNDGKLDLITANASGNSSLLLGDGAGGFGVSDLSIPATEWGPSNSGFAIGDFDHDGNMDFGTSRDPNSIEVYYGDGHGGFPSTRIFAGSSNKDPHAVDFNGDGKLDIVATGHPDPVASVMLGDGSGGFGSAMNFAVGDGPQGSSIADFNNDGKPDIVTPNYFGGDITVMLNTTEAASGSACDQISPSTAASPSSTPNVAGWNNSNVNIALNAVDNTGGSGVKNITYSSSGAQNIPPTTVTGSIASVGIIAEGQTTISYFASDNAGNVESSHNVTVRIDKTAPAISCGSADGSWHAANVSIACSASDPMSGLTVSGDAGFSLSTSVTAGIETSNAATGSHPVCDKAGNCSTAGPIGGNKIDRKDPLITITTPVTGTYFYQQLVNVGYGCSDGGSGVLGCTGTTANGGLLNTSSYGSKTFTVNSTDKVGNSSSSVVNYNVVYHVPANKDQCKNGGWQTLQRPDSTFFKNQGDCVSFVNTGH